MKEEKKVLITIPEEINALLLAYKRALKRNTGGNKNKDGIILDAVNAYVPTLQQRLLALNAEYERKIKALAKKNSNEKEKEN